MQVILRCSMVTQAHGLKLALDAAGISAVIQGEALGGIVGTPFSVWILDDDRLEEARCLVHEMDAAESSTD